FNRLWPFWTTTRIRATTAAERDPGDPHFPILFDENFVLQCTPSAEIADQVTKIYFSWRYGALSNSSDVTPVLDFGNGTLVFTRELKPGYEAELYCSGQCSCSFELAFSFFAQEPRLLASPGTPGCHGGPGLWARERLLNSVSGACPRPRPTPADGSAGGSSALCSDKPCRQHCLLVRDHVCSSEVKLLRRFPDCELFPDADSEPGCHARFDLEAVMLRHAAASVWCARVRRQHQYERLLLQEGLLAGPAVQSGCAKWSSAANRLLSADYFASLRDAAASAANRAPSSPAVVFHHLSGAGVSGGRAAARLVRPRHVRPIRTAVIVAAVAFVILLCCIILGIMLHRRNVAKSSTKRNVKFGQKTHLAKNLPKLERLAYSHDDFADLGKMIGGQADMPKLVALKVLDETADDQIVESFFSEAELLLGMEHRYVMQ
uniref:Protein kinase domain-containing protein n=1 Tax=Macrostomum lignano TaxID=282301 RepID=A0A1I8F8M8_9PLAT